MRRQAVYKPEALLTRAGAMLGLKCTPEGSHAELERLGHLGRFLLALRLRGEEFVQGLLIGLRGFAFHSLGSVQKVIGFLMLMVRSDAGRRALLLLAVGLQRLLGLFLIPEMERSKQLTDVDNDLTSCIHENIVQ